MIFAVSIAVQLVFNLLTNAAGGGEMCAVISCYAIILFKA